MPVKANAEQSCRLLPDDVAATQNDGVRENAVTM
jgi:hypothetical protein